MTYCLSSRKCIYFPSFEHFCVIKRSSPLNCLFWTKCTKSAVDFIINGILGSRNVLSVLCRKTHLLNVFMFKGNKTRCERQALHYTTDPSPISAPFVFQNFPSCLPSLRLSGLWSSPSESWACALASWTASRFMVWSHWPSMTPQIHNYQRILFSFLLYRQGNRGPNLLRKGLRSNCTTQDGEQGSGHKGETQRWDRREVRSSTDVGHQSGITSLWGVAFRWQGRPSLPQGRLVGPEIWAGMIEYSQDCTCAGSDPKI